MAEIKHTPGPWFRRLIKFKETNPFWRISAGPQSGHEWTVADVYGVPDTSETTYGHGYSSANSLLICAAPELLSALETIVEHLAESHATEKDAEHYGDDPEECSYCQSIEAARAAIDKATKGERPR